MDVSPVGLKCLGRAGEGSIPPQREASPRTPGTLNRPVPLAPLRDVFFFGTVL